MPIIDLPLPPVDQQVVANLARPREGGHSPCPLLERCGKSAELATVKTCHFRKRRSLSDFVALD